MTLCVGNFDQTIEHAFDRERLGLLQRHALPFLGLESHITGIAQSVGKLLQTRVVQSTDLLERFANGTSSQTEFKIDVRRCYGVGCKPDGRQERFWVAFDDGAEHVDQGINDLDA